MDESKRNCCESRKDSAHYVSCPVRFARDPRTVVQGGTFNRHDRRARDAETRRMRRRMRKEAAAGWVAEAA